MNTSAKEINKPSWHNPEKVGVGKITIKTTYVRAAGGGLGIRPTRAFPTILLINFSWPNTSTNFLILIVLILFIMHFEGLS